MSRSRTPHRRSRLEDRWLIKGILLMLGLFLVAALLIIGGIFS